MATSAAPSHCKSEMGKLPGLVSLSSFTHFCSFFFFFPHHSVFSPFLSDFFSPSTVVWMMRFLVQQRNVLFWMVLLLSVWLCTAWKKEILGFCLSLKVSASDLHPSSVLIRTPRASTMLSEAPATFLQAQDHSLIAEGRSEVKLFFFFCCVSFHRHL